MNVGDPGNPKFASADTTIGLGTADVRRVLPDTIRRKTTCVAYIYDSEDRTQQSWTVRGHPAREQSYYLQILVSLSVLGVLQEALHVGEAVQLSAAAGLDATPNGLGTCANQEQSTRYQAQQPHYLLCPGAKSNRQPLRSSEYTSNISMIPHHPLPHE